LLSLLLLLLHCCDSEASHCDAPCRVIFGAGVGYYFFGRHKKLNRATAQLGCHPE
jgi:hypothetical protein